KTDFFANVSHEFRTPLTLLLTPLEHLQSRREELPPFAVREIEMAARNSRRLLRLVDALLDFSQIERSRERAVLEPTDLCTLTTDIASAFRSAIESAGLALRVDCAPDLPAVPVNPEMWEKIVSNLLSNALKFTFEGSITVTLRALTLHAELVVTDTGIGIPQAELPNLFKRFHRVRGARARTLEGSGIGLAIVQDLVQRMGGQLTVTSREGAGTSFTVWLPFKTARTLADSSSLASSRTIATNLAEEASRWSSETHDPSHVKDDLLGEPTLHVDGPRATLVVADDNADVRDYLKKLLGTHWNVELAADGVTAFELTRRLRPDIVLADVMMPGLDGFALVRNIRADADLRYTPVILLTARAGEQSAIEGLLAGADDYIAKPFSPRELVARIRGQSELARMRRRAEELNAFLVRFSDAVHGLMDPREVASVACKMAALHLGCDHSHWSEVDWAANEWVVETRFSLHGDVGTPLGRIPIAPGTDNLMAGHPLIIEDRDADPRIPEQIKAMLARFGAAARLAVPVMVDGRAHAILVLGQRTPRRWAPDEIALVEAVAGRCWAEVERARAERSLRTSEENYRSLFESMDEGYALCELVRAEGRPVAVRTLQCNPTFERLARVPREIVDLNAYAEAVTAGETRTIEAFDPSSERWVAVRVHPRGGDRFALLCLDVTTRKLAEQSLAHQAARDAFRVRLADALQRASDIAELQYQACRVLGEQLGATRVAFWVLEPGNVIAVEREWVNGAPAIPARHPFSDVYGAWRERLEKGLPIVRDDVRTDAQLTDPEKAMRVAMGAISGASVPLRTDGKVVAVLAASFGTAHHWREAELELMGEVAERTWAALGRLRAEAVLEASEAALRESEAKLAVELVDTQQLQRVSSLLAIEDDPRTLYQAILDAAMALMRSEFASLQMLVPERNELLLLAHKGFHPDSARHWEWVRADDASTCGVALERGEPVVVRDIEEFDRAAGTEDLASYRRCGIRAIQSTPLIARNGRVVGMISTHWRDPHEPTERELRLLDVLARQAADILERRAAERSLRDSEEKYRSLFETMDEGFALCELVRDAEGRVIDYRYVDENPALIRQAPVRPASLVDTYARVVATGESVLVEHHVSNADRWLRIHAFARGGDRFAVLVGDITDRKRAEDVLRERQERQAFLLELSDTMRDKTTAEDVANTALAMLCEHMRLDRAYIVIFRPGDDHADVAYQTGNDRVPRMPDRLRLKDFPQGHRATRNGTLVIEDNEQRPEFSEAERRTGRGLGLGARVVATLRKGGGVPEATLAVACAAARRWTPGEVALVEDAVERIWPALQRARAEDALRANEQRTPRTTTTA
ncbi:MAG: GAF domain-containing protein, partial [Deltaproteobacteria bacterium]|nr:GAF domain-containing protein [Deltaproteobacteria bacterium]